jgi:hypothetical protein
MSVTIFDSPNGAGSYEGYFPDPAYAYDVGNYALGDYGDTWANDISALSTTTPLNVFDEPNFGGDAVYLPAGFHDLEDLESYGIANNDIASFVAIADGGYAG